jgi:flagellar motor protein MotB
MTLRLRWAVVVVVGLAVSGLTGCKVLTKPEYERLRGYKELSETFENRSLAIAKEREMLAKERDTLARRIQKLEADLAEARALAKKFSADATDSGALARDTVDVAKVMSEQMKRLRKRNQELQEELARKGVEVGPSEVEYLAGPEGEVGIRIAGDVLFEFASATLKEDAKKILDQVIQNDLTTVDKEIRVCGYTDSVPIKRPETLEKWPTNWELSGARAAAVLRYLESQGIASDRLQFCGFGDQRLVKDPATGKEDPARSRRAEIWLLNAKEQPEAGSASAAEAGGEPEGLKGKPLKGKPLMEPASE